MLSFEQLIQNLTDTAQPSIVRSSAIASLVEQGNWQGIECLIETLADPDSAIRREAAKALQQLDATRAEESLLEALQVESNNLTLWAMLEAIGELGTPSAIQQLESLPAVSSMLTRMEVKKSITRIQTRFDEGSTSTPPEATESELDTEHVDLSEPLQREETIEPESDLSSAHNTQQVQNTSSDDPFIDRIKNMATNEVSETESDASEPSVSIETIFADIPKTDENAETAPEKIIDATNATQSHDELIEAMDEAESADEITDIPDTIYPESIDDTEPTDTIATNIDEVESADETTDIPDTVYPESIDDAEPTAVIATDAESTQSEKEKADKEIEDLAESIAKSSRLAGSSVNLPVLAPNAETVPYNPKGTAFEPPRTSFFLTLIHPGRHLSKQWIYRTRVYLLLWAALLIAMIGFTQYQKYNKVELTSSSRIGISDSELPEFVKRSLAEGDFYIQEGYYRKAINSYELSKNIDVLPINFYRKLGFAYFKEGQYALAAEAYEKFLASREDENPDVFAAEASLLGVYPLTSIDARTTLDYETYNILGTAYMKLGHVLKAQNAYEKAIRLAPKYGEAYNNLARLYADNSMPTNFDKLNISPLLPTDFVLQTSPRLRLAEALAYTAVTLNPDVAAYHDTLGWILSKRGQVNKAMRTLERAIDLQGDAVEPHYHLAQVALKANERKKAVKAIRNVFKLNPAFVRLNADK